MSEESAQSVLQRLLRKAGEAAVGAEITPKRIVRLSMARAAQTSIGLHLTVLGVTEEAMPFDDVLALITDEMMLLSLGLEGEAMGFAALDLQLRTATVEMQTVGVMAEAPAAERGITEADAALCAPLVTEFLEDLARTATDTPIEGWADGYAAGVRFASGRAIGMALEDRPMRLVRLQLDLGGNERQAELLIALPSGGKPQPLPSASRKAERFDQQMRDTVMEAPTNLTAVLHRFRLPLRDIRAFEVGQVIGLPGVTVGSVRLEAPDGTRVAEARLGQSTGLRALRISGPAAPQLAEASMGPGDGAAMGMPFGGDAPLALPEEPAGGGFDGLPDMAPMGEGGDGFPALDPPGDLPDLPLPPDMGADAFPSEPPADAPADLGADMPDFAAAPMGEGEFGFPAMGEMEDPS